MKDEHLRQALSFHTLLVGGNPMTTSAIYALIHKLEKDGGVWFAKGGTNRLVAAMVTQFERLGGTLRLGDPVAEIETLGDRATGVRTASGWRGDFDAVASQRRHRPHLSRSAVGHRRAASSAAAALARKKFSPSLFVVHFGIKGAWPGIPHHMILFGPRYKGLLDRHLRSWRAAGGFLALPAPPDRHRSVDGAGGLLDLLRAGAGAAHGQAADRLGRRSGRSMPIASSPRSSGG